MRVGPLRAGDKLPTEAAIMREFGVSRTVVREALSKLQAAGLVRPYRGVGSFVLGASRAKPFLANSSADDSLAQARDLFELRLGLEPEAAAFAAQRRSAADLLSLNSVLQALDAALDLDMDTALPDFQFHLEIARASHSMHFAAVLEALGPTCVPTALLAKAPEQGQGVTWKDHVRREHRAVFDAIERQDAAAARAAMRAHLSGAWARRQAWASTGAVSSPNVNARSRRPQRPPIAPHA
jgi:DNA-binding FadR family transcriptional regulator